MIQLKHHFLYNCTDLDFLINVTKLSGFTHRLVKLGSKQNPDLYDPLKYMGDGWEFFAEFFFKFFNGDHTLTYLWDYEPVLGFENGIDGLGKSTLDASLATVQCKFVAKVTDYLSNKHNLGNHCAASINENWKPNGKNLICFTTASGIHRNHPYHDAALCLNNKLISRRVNGNVAFWTIFKNTVKENLNGITRTSN